ncbi:hypothetical protein F4777DRAFT_551690 [Nemania sp. FL0916]|nr:hypothetical protein F4777DRAFT_551690 [Nemania sp. FL0916]
MLLRQLHRPLLRSVTATWRPATTSPAFFHHGDSRRSDSGNDASTGTSTDTNSSDDKIDINSQQPTHEKHEFAPREPAARAPIGLPGANANTDAASDTDAAETGKQAQSLFDQLFPYEAKTSRGAGGVKSAWASQLSDEEIPRLAVLGGLEDEDGDISLLEPSSESEVGGLLSSSALRAKSMLILSAASKNLLESDFLRLGVQGKHVEGWVGGIVKVIQARNPDTLEPQGHYFILFDTYESARAYRDRLERQWRLGKRYVPGAHHARASTSHLSVPLPTGLRRTEKGEDVAKLVRAFTLVPPSQRRRVELSRATPARVAELQVEGGFVDRLARTAGSEYLVLVRFDDGRRLPLAALRRALADDGARRNLPWRIASPGPDLGGDPNSGFEYGGGDGVVGLGILPFGRSIVKAKDRAEYYDQNQDQDRGQGETDNAIHGTSPAQDVDSSDGGSGGGSDAATKNSDASSSGKKRATAAHEARKGDEENRQYPRFIIPFADEAEAYRFVQEWHRRELRLQMGGGGKKDPSWEETRVVNASILW